MIWLVLREGARKMALYFGKKHKPRFWVVCLMTSVALMSATGLQAEGLSGGSPWQISADRISRFTNPEFVVAEGSVVLTRVTADFANSGSLSGEKTTGFPPPSKATKSTLIKGDWVRFDPMSQIVNIKGNVSLDSEDEKITAESAVFDLDDHTGTLSKATLYFPKRELLLAGETVEKTGELVYHLVNGWASKCGPQGDSSPPWSFGWQEANINYGGFVYFKHITFRVKDVPLLYSPLFAFSSNKKRKTGLLRPEISQSSRDGVGVLQPLFLDLSPSSDLTFHGGYLSERGLQAGAELRYVLSNDSKGTFAVNYLHDDLDDSQDDFKNDGLIRTTENRYWLRGKVNHKLGHEILAKLDLDLVSDQDYLQEFNDGLIGFTASQESFTESFNRGFNSETTLVRTNVGQLTRSWLDTSLNGELKIFNDPSEISSNSHLWSLPRVIGGGRLPLFRQLGLKGGAGRFMRDTDLSWDSEYIYYWRKDGVGAQRLDLRPRLVAPLRFIPYLETAVSAGVRETFYNVDDNSPVPVGFDSGIMTRTLQEYEITASTVFLRKFSGHWGDFKQLSHMVRPRVFYDYIPTKDQSQFPDLDAADQIEAKNLLTYEIANDFDLLGIQSNGLEKTRKFAYLTISQSYDFEENSRILLGSTDSRQPFSAVNFDVRFYPIDGLSIASDSFLDVYGRGFIKYEILGNYFALAGYDFGLEYRYDKDHAVDQLNANFQLGLSDHMRMKGNFLHSFEIGETSAASLGIIYNPGCWSVEFLAASSLGDEYRFSAMFSLAGIGGVFNLNQTMLN